MGDAGGAGKRIAAVSHRHEGRAPKRSWHDVEQIFGGGAYRR